MHVDIRHILQVSQGQAKWAKNSAADGNQLSNSVRVTGKVCLLSTFAPPLSPFKCSIVIPSVPVRPPKANLNTSDERLTLSRQPVAMGQRRHAEDSGVHQGHEWRNQTSCA